MIDVPNKNLTNLRGSHVDEIPTTHQYTLSGLDLLVYSIKEI
jgi:hypothetical protein